MTNLVPTFRFGALDLTQYPFSIEFGSDRGSPAAVVAAVSSALRDGAISRITRHDNRTVTLTVLVEGASHALLADREAALMAEVVKARNTFTFNPGDGAAFNSVYDTFAAELAQQYDDGLEQNMYRRFVLTFEAAPWPRSATKVSTPAVATGATTVVNDGSVTTGWTAQSPAGAVVSVASGAVVNTYPSPATGAGLRLAGTVATTTTKYIAVDWKTSVPAYQGLWVNDTGIQYPEVRREPAPTAGFTRSWYYVSDIPTSVSSLTFVVVHSATSASATLSIDQVVKSSTLPVTGTMRQLTRTIDPGGSIPAEGTIMVQHATAGLGHTLVYTHSTVGGYSPPLRKWMATTDPTTADAASVSGSRNALGGVARATIPVGSIPAGEYHLWARMHRNAGTGSLNVTWTAKSAMGSNFVGPTQTGTVSCNFPVQDVWYLFPLGRLTLPTTQMGPAGYVILELIAASSAVVLDEAWLFAMDEGTLTVADCGAGTPGPGVSNRLRVDAPSLDRPFGSIMVAQAADWSDAYTPAVTIFCDQVSHKFDPSGSAIHVVTSGPSTEASVSLEHYPRWHSNAGS